MPATKTRQSLVPRNMPRLRLSLMMPLSHHSLCNGPQPAWNPAGRAFRVAVQSFFRSPFPQARTLGKRREAWDTRRLCALRTVSMLKPKSQPAVDVPFLGNQTWIDFIWRTHLAHRPKRDGSSDGTRPWYAGTDS